MLGVTSPFGDREIVADMEFLFGGEIPPEVINRIHREGIPDLERLATAETLYFVIGSYDEPQQSRLQTVREVLSEPAGDEAFMLKDIDPEIDTWQNFYVKFRVFLLRCQYLIGVFEDNNGGHELELGEGEISKTYVLKRDYEEVSIEADIEHEKYDAMLGTLFQLLDARDRLHTWATEAELTEETRRVSAAVGNGRGVDE